jgi:hypothetical protein
MVTVGLTGDLSASPKAVADFSVKNGYFVDGLTSWALMSEGAESFGLFAEELPNDENRIIDALESGRPVIMSVGKGDFTSSCHFIVLTGVTPDGKIKVNDPNSLVRSKQEWELGILCAQMKNLWAYSAAEPGV